MWSRGGGAASTRRSSTSATSAWSPSPQSSLPARGCASCESGGTTSAASSTCRPVCGCWTSSGGPVGDIAHNRIAKLENLPGGLHDLDVSHNKIKKLENLPQNLFRLIAYHNKISKLENLPAELNSLQLYFDDLAQPVDYLKDSALFLRQIRFSDPSRQQSEGRGWLRRPAIDIPQLLLDINSGARAAVHEREREKQRRLVRALLMHVLRKRLRLGVQDICPIILSFLWM